MPPKRSGGCKFDVYQRGPRFYIKPKGMTNRQMQKAGATYSEPFT